MSSRGASLTEQAAFWKEELAGAPTKLELPTDKPRPAVQSLRFAVEKLTLPAPLVAALEALGAREEASPFMTLAAAFAVVLQRYSGQDDVLVATPIGLNTVVLRARFGGADRSFREFLRDVRARVLAAAAHSDVPFEQLVAELVPDRDASHAPLCQVMLVLDPAEPVDAARFDLSLSVAATADGLEGSIAYSTDLFEPATIGRLGGHLRALLEAVAREPDQSIFAAPILTERERTQILREWNDTRVEQPAACAPQLFEEQAARHADDVAVVFEGRTLTYREVNERANQVAHYLLKRGVGPDALVGVCLERCPEMAIALLGVWKAGGAYVPLDPSHPPERLAFMLEDAAAKILITDEALRPLFGEIAAEVVRVDGDGAAIAQQSTSNPPPSAGPSHLAYVMYTSGSTGQPKGVMIVHEGLTNYLCWARQAYAVDAGEAVPVFTSIAFDLTVTALIAPLVGGGRVELLREDVGGQKLVAALREVEGRSLVKITPAHLALLSDTLGPETARNRTRVFVIGGEQLVAESLALWRDHAPDTRLINEYGPTETVVGCCVHEVRPDDPRTGAVSIGKPIANTQLYVLDRHKNPLPVGVQGELYIGGAGVARGYLNRPELTAEKFVPDPFVAGGRLYRTGDLARWRADGSLEFLGRIDNQVKVRGFRIELGEIEAKLADLPSVKACAVLAREDTPGGKHLCGYVVAERGHSPTVDELRNALRADLPEYMVPAQFVFLESMPLTSNGKVDRKALPAPSHDRGSTAGGAPGAPPRTAPRTPIEKKLAAIWSELLQIESIGVDENFFELGGHSLLAIKAVSRIRDAFEVELSPQAVIDDPTIAGLAKMVAELTGDTGTTVVEARSGPFFFGSPQLFGVYHPSLAATARDTALLVCPSIGHEYTRAHRAVAVLCESAARAGFSALRFDYGRMGDSAGDFSGARVDGWCDDIARAIGELLSRSGAAKVHVVGLRLGAALAAAALARGSVAAKVKSLCLWDPLLSGKEFLTLAEEFQQRFLRDPGRFSEQTIRARPPGDEDLLVGYSYGDGLRRSLVELDLRRTEAWPALPIRAVLSEPSPAWAELAPKLSARGRDVEWEQVRGAEAAFADYALHEKTLRAGPVISRIVDKLQARLP